MTNFSPLKNWVLTTVYNESKQSKGLRQMDSIGLLLTILIILIIGAAAILTYFNSKSESTPAPKPPEPPPSSKPPTPVPEKKVEKNYVTIYAYSLVSNKKRCAYCDGENDYGAKVCCICGSNVDG